jgi:hypothetical protein
MVEFFVPAATHEDTRFYTLDRGGFFIRAGYALSRVVTRSDAGNPTLNITEVVGAGISAGISSTYYPTRERSFSNTGSQWGVNVAIDAMAYVAKKFWPDINHRLFHGDKSISSPASSPATP